MKNGLVWTVPCVLFLALAGCVAASPDAALPPTAAAAPPTATAAPPTATAAPPTATGAPPTAAAASPTATAAPESPASPPVESTGDLADVVSVEVAGDPGAYRFRVGVLSPDTGCDQYADWWEVVGEDGTLIYRRVLLHSHVGEQPFERSGSPVPVEAGTVVYVRAHLHPVGYGGVAFKGSAQAGFEQVELSADFAAELAKEEPLPQGCAF